MTHAARQHFTFDEYVTLEEVARVKHEYLAGQVWAMSGGSPAHAGIAANVISLLPCERHGDVGHSVWTPR